MWLWGLRCCGGWNWWQVDRRGLRLETLLQEAELWEVSCACCHVPDAEGDACRWWRPGALRCICWAEGMFRCGRRSVMDWWVVAVEPALVTMVDGVCWRLTGRRLHSEPLVSSASKIGINCNDEVTFQHRWMRSEKRATACIPECLGGWSMGWSMARRRSARIATHSQYLAQENWNTRG